MLFIASYLQVCAEYYKTNRHKTINAVEVFYKHLYAKQFAAPDWSTSKNRAPPTLFTDEDGVSHILGSEIQKALSHMKSEKALCEDVFAADLLCASVDSAVRDLRCGCQILLEISAYHHSS